MLERAGGKVDQADLKRQLCAAYASGGLSPAMELLVETQSALAPADHELETAEAIAEAMFESESPAPLSGGLEGTWARLGPAPRQEQAPPCAVRAAATRANAVLDEILRLPRTVHDAALGSLGRGGWTFAGPGIRSLELDVGDRDAKAEIIRIEPGWGAPRHGHGGGEYTLVLCGSFNDEGGRYDAGEIAYGGPGITHRPVANPGEVCYSLAVTDGPLVFTGALGLLHRIWRH